MSSEAEKIFLYWGSGSAPCWRVMIALEEKGLSGYGNKLLSFSLNEHKSDEVLKLNPRGQVPTFRHDGIILNESLGICHYLEDTFKKQGTNLIPEDPKLKAMVLQRMYEIENIQEKGIRRIMYYQWSNTQGQLDEQVLLERCNILSVELEIWEKYLESPFVAGDTFTMADAIFFPTLAILIRGSLPLRTRPNLKRYYEELSERQSIKVSWPPHFKITSPTQIFARV